MKAKPFCLISVASECRAKQYLNSKPVCLLIIWQSKYQASLPNFGNMRMPNQSVSFRHYLKLFKSGQYRQMPNVGKYINVKPVCLISAICECQASLRHFANMWMPSHCASFRQLCECRASVPHFANMWIPNQYASFWWYLNSKPVCLILPICKCQATVRNFGNIWITS